jgi:hypothetical protein
MVKNIFAYEIVGDRRCSTPRYVVYAVGQWDNHIMDWLGGNYRRTKVPGQPKFTSLKEATTWARVHYEEFERLVSGIEGSHISQYNDSFGDRTLIETGGDGSMSSLIGEDGELDAEAWDEYCEVYE